MAEKYTELIEQARILRDCFQDYQEDGNSLESRYRNEEQKMQETFSVQKKNVEESTKKQAGEINVWRRKQHSAIMDHRRKEAANLTQITNQLEKLTNNKNAELDTCIQSLWQEEQTAENWDPIKAGKEIVGYSNGKPYWGRGIYVKGMNREILELCERVKNIRAEYLDRLNEADHLIESAYESKKAANEGSPASELNNIENREKIFFAKQEEEHHKSSKELDEKLVREVSGNVKPQLFLNRYQEIQEQEISINHYEPVKEFHYDVRLGQIRIALNEYVSSFPRKGNPSETVRGGIGSAEQRLITAVWIFFYQ